MPSYMKRRRSAFTLAEVVISMVILGVLGVAMTRMLINESRLFEVQQASREARAVGRSSMNVLFSDLRMVQDGAGAPGTVLVAKADSLKVRVPYAFGVVCGNGVSALTVSMLPADSSIRMAATYAGYAWRNRTNGVYTYVPVPTPADTPVTATSPSTCTTVAMVKSDTIGVRSWPPLDLTPVSPSAQPGAPLYLYQEVAYWFGASTAYPGRRGLWRQATGGGAEELVAPFDSTSRFKFYIRSTDTPTLTAPVVLDSLVGVAIALNGASVSNIPGRQPVKTRMETSVFFRNRRNP